MIITMMEILNVMMVVVVMCVKDAVFLAFLAARNDKPLL